jgi:hypothetical protein
VAQVMLHTRALAFTALFAALLLAGYAAYLARRPLRV